MPREPHLNDAAAPSRRRHRLFGWSAAVFVMTLVATGLLLGAYQRQLQQERHEAALLSNERMLSALRDQLQRCDMLVRSIQALFLASESVTPEEFRRVYEVLRIDQRFAGLQAVVLARRSAPDEPLSYITDLVAPLAGNERVVGLDVVSQPANLRVVEQSRDSDRPVMSASFRLIQRSGIDEPVDGVVIRVPAFTAGPVPQTVAERRAREIGSIAVSFRISELVRDGLSHMLDARYQVRVTDVTEATPALLYDSALYGHTAAAAANVTPVLGRLEYGERIWELAVWPIGSADAATWSLWVGSAAGLLLAGLLAALVWTLLGRHQHALVLAETLSRRYRESEARFRALNEVLPVAVVLSRESDGRLEYVNASGRRLLALGDAVRLDHRLDDFIDAGTEADAAIRPQEHDDDDAPLAAVRALRADDGHCFWATLAEHELELDGEAKRLTVITDVSELRELTDRLVYQASHDSLTGLINRREFERRLALALADGERGIGHGLLYIDLDQFKLVNDVSGHLAGDALLAQLGGVLRTVLGKRDVIARLGGDEFGVLADSGEREVVQALAERLRIAIDEFVFSWDGRPYAISASIGAVMIDVERPRGQRELLSLADTACYMAKEAGRNRVHLFAEDDIATSRRLREMEWVSRLRSALAEERLCLYYQELQPLNPDGLQGAHFELLIRLRDEQGELVPPGAFVPAAERYGLMPLLDRWVVKTALQHFDRLHPAGADVAMCAINLSATTMEDEAFPAFVLDELKRSGVAAERLCFEVTETAAVANLSRVVSLITRLRALGCRFAIDDFGAGMSSFGYLKDLPVDFIKIDGCFIREIETDPMSYSIVRAVTDIGHQMGAGVIAEFVNSTRTCDLLRDIGVDYVQGFLIHKPVPALCGQPAEAA